MKLMNLRKLKITDKDIGILKVVSQIAAGFTLIVALTMIFSFVQLKIINPLDSPVLVSLKDQFDKDPSNALKAEQVRAMDLMARKAYFSSRWQVEAGSYLLLGGVIVFILCQRLVSENEKLIPVIPGSKVDTAVRKGKSRQYLLVAGTIITVSAVALSFVLRNNLPGTEAQPSSSEKSFKNGRESAAEPDKTNYPFFRGQDSRGIAGGSGYPTEWDGPSGKNVIWKVPVPKKGKSSPVVWDDKLFITGAEGMTCELYCIDKKSGNLLWTGNASDVPGQPTVLPKMDAEGGLAVSTAATDGKVVCAIFANGNLVCYDMKGTLKWSKNVGVPENSYGYTSSLLIYNNLLIVQFDSNSKLSLKGFEIETGEQKWETPRTGRSVWSSPVLAYFDGKAQVIVNGNPKVSSYNVLTGEEIWSIDCLTGDVAPSVAVNSTMTYAVTDYAKLAAIKPGSAPSIVWEDNTFTPDVSSPVATDEFLFVSTGTGDIACYNSLKGDTLWTHYFNDPFYASPIIAGDQVYLLDRTGVMHIVKAASRFQLVGESKLEEHTDCTPAFSDKKIYIRGIKNLYCIAKN